MKHLQSFYNDRQVLVTGGAGFIGSHLTQALCSYGAHVTVLDDLSTGSLENLGECEERIRFLAGDVTCFKDCFKATKNQDIVFHTAAFVSVPESVKYPARCEKINIHGTGNVLEACIMNNVSTFIFSSSAAVYGERNDVCCEDDKVNPQSPYATSKLEGEFLCKEFNKKHGIKTAILRYFNVYGPRQNPHGPSAGVFAKFQENILHDIPVVVYGDGEQKRDFVPVLRVVEANLAIAMLQTNGDIFNIATGESISLLTLISKIEREINKKCTKMLFEPVRKGDIFSSHASCKKYDEIRKNLTI
jgi:UDP-glucose 4-epimerase